MLRVWLRHPNQQKKRKNNKSTAFRRCFCTTRVYKPGSVLTAIYLDSRSLASSSRLHGTVGQTICSSTALLRIEFTAPPCSHEAGALLPHLFTLTANVYGIGSDISLLHLSWGHPRQALPVILALWSPDFPHALPFGRRPRLSNPVAEILYPMGVELSNVLQNLF